MRKLANAAAKLKAQSFSRPRRWPTLWVMTDVTRLPDPTEVIQRLPRGSGVILRHPDAAARRGLAEKIRPLCKRRGVICLIAEDWRLAAAVRADGLHLPERQARIGVSAGALLWRRRFRKRLTVAAHGRAALTQANRLHPDAIVLSPVFATASHPGVRVLGAVRFAALARLSRTAIIALGGLTATTVRRLTHSRARGIAAIGALAKAGG